MTKKPFETRSCTDCGAAFGAYNRVQFRCKPCQARYKNRRPKRYTVACNRCGDQFHPRDTRSRSCAKCWDHFPCTICKTPTKRTGTAVLYCSTRCSYLAKLVQKHGDRNYLHALERDGFMCVLCASEGGLHVHHIDHRGLGYPKDERNNALANLVTLCNPCHGRVHAVTERELYARHGDTVAEVFAGLRHSSCAPQR